MEECNQEVEGVMALYLCGAMLSTSGRFADCYDHIRLESPSFQWIMQVDNPTAQKIW